MAGAPQSTNGFRRRRLGYDRAAVDAALTTAADRLERAEKRRDELIETTANVERIGAHVAEMLRSLADRAAQLEEEAAATASRVVQDAELEADQIRAQAAAVLADAEATAQTIVESSRKEQLLISERRETALSSLRIAMDQMGRLATTIDQIDLTADTTPPGPTGERPPEETVVHLPWPLADQPSPPAAGPPAPPVDHPTTPVLAHMDGWGPTP